MINLSLFIIYALGIKILKNVLLLQLYNILHLYVHTYIHMYAHKYMYIMYVNISISIY